MFSFVVLWPRNSRRATTSFVFYVSGISVQYLETIVSYILSKSLVVSGTRVNLVFITLSWPDVKARKAKLKKKFFSHHKKNTLSA